VKGTVRALEPLFDPKPFPTTSTPGQPSLLKRLFKQ
jgi:hypothetical protein